MTLATVEAALAIMLDPIVPLGVEKVPVADTDRRWLAEDVFAGRDQPPFDASSMDGWALRGADASAGADLAIIGESAAGRGFRGEVRPGQAVRISTGAPLPVGADRVVIQEEVERVGDRIRLGSGPLSPVRIRERGCDYRAGDRLLATGQRIDPWRLALAASAGVSFLMCRKRPVVAVLTTGDELVEPGRPVGPDSVFDAAGPALAAVVTRQGGIARRLPLVGDRDEAVAELLREQAFDLLVTIGGASVGDHDRVKPALKGMGAVVCLEGVAMRPGRPVWFAVLADGRPILGLPGNPASALVCAELFLSPIIARMQGGSSELAAATGILTAPLPVNGPRDHYIRARSEAARDGSLRVTPFPDQDSSLIGVMAEADTLIRRPPHAPAVAAGGTVDLLFPAHEARPRPGPA